MPGCLAQLCPLASPGCSLRNNLGAEGWVALVALFPTLGRPLSVFVFATRF
jgi:hypothetical protein